MKILKSLGITLLILLMITIIATIGALTPWWILLPICVSVMWGGVYLGMYGDRN